MSELKPCPFCGGEAQIIESDYGMYLTGYAVYCKGECHAKLGVSGRLGEAYEWIPVFDTEAEAIEAWNTRYEPMMDAIPMTEENMRKYGWVKERTCTMEHSFDGWFTCSECNDSGQVNEWDVCPNYCPNCGARVTPKNSETTPKAVSE